MSLLSHDPAGSTHDQARTFTHNAAGQIASSASSNSLYDWDAAAGYDETYTHNDLDQLTGVGAAAATHDARGNLTDDGTRAYAYDADNRLTDVGASFDLSYDPAGRLYETAGSSTTRFLYSGGQAIGEYDASGTLLRRYVPGAGLDEPVAWYEGSGTTDRRFLHAFATDRFGLLNPVYVLGGYIGG